MRLSPAALILSMALHASLVLLAAEAPALRLPASVKPERYRLHLTLKPGQDRFEGTAEIDLAIAEASPVLWLNATGLEFRSAALRSAGRLLPARVQTTPRDFAGFLFDPPAPAGPAVLRVEYTGEISRKEQNGVFQMKDRERWYVFTQFEPVAARKAFPCYDEPEYKVPWQVTLTVPRQATALSNTPEVSRRDNPDGTSTVVFAETRPLPAYLVAMAAGEFDIVEAGAAGRNRTRVRMISPKGRAGEASYAAQTTGRILGLLEDYFGMPYPYEKLDQLAVPLAGYAMEHPGLVTYGDELILRPPALDTPARQRLYVSVAAHELGHQWFGDLVTTRWWDDIWLNEGFASWIANKISARFDPSWRMEVAEVDAMQGAMSQDGLLAARIVRQPIESHHDIENAFDSITYRKGEALLQMFESYLGEDRFQAGIRRYLAKYADRNATSEDFLAAIAGGDTKIARAFSSFLDQPGVPLVSAALRCGGGPPRAELSQERYVPLGAQAPPGSWTIPVCVKYPAGEGAARACALMEGPEARIPLDQASGCPAWISANAGAAGYYRTLYKDGLLQRLLDAWPQQSLPERVSILGDLGALVRSGRLSQGAVLALAPRFASDPDRDVTLKAIALTQGVERFLVPARLRPKWQAYLSGLYSARARQAGFRPSPGEDANTRLLRPALMGVALLGAGEPDLVAEAKRLAGAWLEDRNAIEPDMSGLVLAAAARDGDRAFFERLLRAARAAKEARERSRIFQAMGRFRDPAVARAALDVILGGEFDPRETLAILFGETPEPETAETVFAFIQRNFDRLAEKLPEGAMAGLPHAASGFCDSAHRAAVESFFTKRATKFRGGPRVLAQVLERISLCEASRKAQQPGVVEFLENR